MAHEGQYFEGAEGHGPGADPQGEGGGGSYSDSGFGGGYHDGGGRAALTHAPPAWESRADRL
ncbi:MAG: hypothetical protein ACRD0U_00900, partial [Acidimicrobiales bacterium]